MCDIAMCPNHNEYLFKISNHCQPPSRDVPSDKCSAAPAAAVIGEGDTRRAAAAAGGVLYICKMGIYHRPARGAQTGGARPWHRTLTTHNLYCLLLLWGHAAAT